MKIFLFAPALLCVLLFTGFRLHPYFVSMTELTYNPKEKRMEVAVRIFTDDLEKALARDCKCKVDLADLSQLDKNEGLIEKYLNAQLKITSDGKQIKTSFLGFERLEESTWSYLQSGIEPTLPKKVTVENSLLYEVQNKQSNLVRLKLGDLDKTKQVSFPDTRMEF